MNENTISYKLDRIKNATDRMRTKTGVVDGVIEDVATAVESMDIINNQDKEITTNGTYSAEEGYTGLGTVNVNIPDGGYKGQLPNNSSIKSIVNVGSTLRVYLNVDRLASGTRVYYKENDVPTLDDNYIDINPSDDYGVIENININSMYGIRVASYIIYDGSKKAFNNSLSIGSVGLKLTTQINPSGAILLDIPTEDAGNAPKSVAYSKYSNCAYVAINSKLYKINLNLSNPTFERIASEYTLNSTPRLCPTSKGLFFRGTSYHMRYDETTGEIITTNLYYNNYIFQLSNGDVFGYPDSTGSMIYTFNENSLKFDQFAPDYKYSMTASPAIIDSEFGIFLFVRNHSIKTSSNYYQKAVYKYNAETSTYEMLGTLPANINDNSHDVYQLIPLINSYALRIDQEIYYLRGNEFISVGINTTSNLGTNVAPSSTYFSSDVGLVQSPIDSSILYLVVYTYYSSATINIWEIDMNTNSHNVIYNRSNLSTGQRPWAEIVDNTLVTNFGYYDLITKTWTQLSNPAPFSNIKKINGKLYQFSNVIYFFNTATHTWDKIYSGLTDNADYTTMWCVPLTTTKVLLCNCYSGTPYTHKGAFIFDTDTNEVTQITDKPYNYLALNNGKIYLFSSTSSTKQSILDINTLELTESIYNGGKPISTYEIDWYRLCPFNKTTYNTLFQKATRGIDALYNTLWDSTLKQLNGFDELLLDLSSSSKTYTMYSDPYYMYLYEANNLYLLDADKTEIVICFSKLANNTGAAASE